MRDELDVEQAKVVKLAQTESMLALYRKRLEKAAGVKKQNESIKTSNEELRRIA